MMATIRMHAGRLNFAERNRKISECREGRFALSKTRKLASREGLNVGRKSRIFFHFLAERGGRRVGGGLLRRGGQCQSG